MEDQIEKTGQAATEQSGSGPEKTGTTEPQKTEAITIDKLPPEIIEQITSKVKAEFNAELSSRDRKITEYQKALKEKELEGKTEKEKAEILAKEKEEELQMKQAALEVAQANFFKTKTATEEGLDPSVIELVTGRTEEEIKSSVQKIKALWNKAEQAGIDKTLKGTSTIPIKGQGAQSGSNIASLQAQLNEAKKNGNQILASQIYAKIEEYHKNTK